MPWCKTKGWCKVCSVLYAAILLGHMTAPLRRLAHVGVQRTCWCKTILVGLGCTVQGPQLGLPRCYACGGDSGCRRVMRQHGQLS